MLRKLLLTLVLTGVLAAAVPATAEEGVEQGVILLGQGPCYECSEQETYLSVAHFEIPAGSTWELRYEPALPGNQLHAYVRLGQPELGIPDVLAVYGEPGTVAQSFEVVFTGE